MKKIAFILLSILLLFHLVSCGGGKKNDEHDHENAVTVHEHTWSNATCTFPKTCSVCKATEGDALGHTPNAPDGDCNTALLCSVCNATVREAGVHLPERDDGNCTTEVKCDECGEVTTEAKSGHVDADGDYFCDDQNCAVSLLGAPEDNSPGFDLPIVPN